MLKVVRGRDSAVINTGSCCIASVKLLDEWVLTSL